MIRSIEDETSPGAAGGAGAVALPREAVVAWEGYLAGLIEWDVLSVAEHEDLCDLLPPIDDSPVMHILIGWDEEKT